MRTSFVLVTELTPRHLDWRAAQEQVEGLAVSLQPRLGLEPRVRLASLPPDHPNRVCLGGSSSGDDLATVLAEEAEAGFDEIFVVPTMLDFGLVQRARLSETVGGVRLDYHRALVAYDDVAFDRRPLLQAFSERIHRELAGSTLSPARSGLLLLASGEGDTSGRAQTYQLMRLVFDQLCFARGEVAFLDHARPLLEEQLERCAREALDWAIVPQMMWRSEPFEDARHRFDAFRRTHPEAQAWTLLSPVGISPVSVDRDPVAFDLAAWLAERIMVLWRSRRQQFEAKRPSPIQGESTRISVLRGPSARLPIAELSDRGDGDFWYGDGCIAEIYDEKGLVGLLDRMLGPACTDRVFIKVTWHGYATGTYTDPVALDKLLAALPAQVVLVEGHTSSRNLGGASWDWQTQGQRASLTNMFGLIPTPLRTKWHGRTVAHFARVCCDIAKIYRCLFRTYGMVEALNVAVKWNPRGLYRSRWGNYDLIPNTGIVTLSPNLATSDVLASRLQGLPVDDNLFFQTVLDEIGFPEAAARLPIPEDLVARLA